MARSTLSDRYDGVAQLLHWTVLLLVVLQYGTKWLSPGHLPFLTKQGLNAWHFGIGPALLLLMLVRLGWRATHPPPPPPHDIAPALQLLSRTTHWMFYALLIVLPVLGWIAASGFGARVTLLGLMPLPAVVSTDRSLAEAAGGAHATLAWVLLAIIGLHVAGALFHVLVKHDDVLGRMLPSRR